MTRSERALLRSIQALLANNGWAVGGAIGDDVVTATTAALTLYVDDATGDDANDGSSGSPKATIMGALDALPIVIAHDVTIAIGPGTYAENVEFSRLNILATLTLKAMDTSDVALYDNGTATSGGATSLTDTGKAWATNQFAGGKVFVYSGTGPGQIRTISSNTATALTVSSSWTTNPASGSLYVIIGPVNIAPATGAAVAVDGKTGVTVTGIYHEATSTSSAAQVLNQAEASFLNCGFASGAGANVVRCELLSILNLTRYDIEVDGTGIGINLVDLANMTINTGQIVNRSPTGGTGIQLARTCQGIASGSSINRLQGFTRGDWIRFGSGWQNTSPEFVYSGCTTNEDIDTTNTAWASA